MKNKNNTARSQNQKNIIDISGKKSINIINHDVENITDDEYKEMHAKIDDISKNIRLQYYSSNILINQTKKRNFYELLEILFYRMKNIHAK